jgi:hypothetical protein
MSTVDLYLRAATRDNTERSYRAAGFIADFRETQP